MPSTQQVLRLSRDVESGRVIYQQLLNREQELSIARSSAIGNVRIIDPAVTRPQPVKPKKRWSSFWGSPGLFVSAGWIPARSMLRMGIETPEQLEEHGINVYATVPLSEWLAKRCVCVKDFMSPGCAIRPNISLRRRIIRSISPWRRFAACAPACISR